MFVISDYSRFSIGSNRAYISERSDYEKFKHRRSLTAIQSFHGFSYVSRSSVGSNDGDWPIQATEIKAYIL